MNNRDTGTVRECANNISEYFGKLFQHCFQVNILARFKPKSLGAENGSRFLQFLVNLIRSNQNTVIQMIKQVTFNLATRIMYVCTSLHPNYHIGTSLTYLCRYMIYEIKVTSQRHDRKPLFELFSLSS